MRRTRKTRHSAHFCHGHVPLAFVFSAPGTDECLTRWPVAGDTGMNLTAALEYLHSRRRSLFRSRNRYSYRLTNAHVKCLAHLLGTRRTEATPAQVLEDRNVRRVRRELKGCGVVVLCGQRAQMLSRFLQQRSRLVVHMCHVGNKGLNGKYRNSALPRGMDPEARRLLRVKLWAQQLLKSIPSRRRVV
jgi:uracil-DNA glycosylase